MCQKNINKMNLLEEYEMLKELTIQQKKDLKYNLSILNIGKNIKLYVQNKIDFNKLFRVIKVNVDYNIKNEKALKAFIDEEIVDKGFIKDRDINPFVMAIIYSEWS